MSVQNIRYIQQKIFTALSLPLRILLLFLGTTSCSLQRAVWHEHTKHTAIPANVTITQMRVTRWISLYNEDPS